MKIDQFAGPSESGKTTHIVELIERHVRKGLTVAAIKHTHHPLNEDDRGDTAKFRKAGANPVILADDHEAVIFDGDSKRRIKFEEPDELLSRLTANVVIIEGWKNRVWRL